MFDPIACHCLRSKVWRTDGSDQHAIADPNLVWAESIGWFIDTQGLLKSVTNDGACELGY
jgi:hypothetical protein